jgi:AraC-like DNA-binding protein
LRLREAGMLLKNGIAVKAAALQIGYKHSSSFSRAFKSFFGFPPIQLFAKQTPATEKGMHRYCGRTVAGGLFQERGL